MKVEMNLGILISFFTVFLLSTSVLGQDETTTTASDNVVLDATVQSSQESKPETELETTPNTPAEINLENKESGGANSTEEKSTTEDNVNQTQENVTPGLNDTEIMPEAQLAAEEKIAVNQDNVTVPPKEEIQVTEPNAKDEEPLIVEGLPVQDNTAPPTGKEILPTDDKILLKTLSGMTDQDKVNKPVKVKKATSAENQEGYIEKEDQLEPEGNETKIEPEDQEQQEVNIVFPTNNPNKEDEFERMAKQIKPNKELDEKLAKKLAGDYGEHIDHNKEDEQPNFVFPTQQNKSDQGEPMKIESEAEVSDNDEKTNSEDEKKRELKDVRTALNLTSTEDKNDGKSTNTSDVKKDTLKVRPQNAMILDESEEEQPNEPKPKEGLLQVEPLKSSENKMNEDSKTKKGTEDNNEEKVKEKSLTLKKDNEIERMGEKKEKLKITGAEQRKNENETHHKNNKTQNKTQQDENIPAEHTKVLPLQKSSSSNTREKVSDPIKLNTVEKLDHIQKENTIVSGDKNEASQKSNLNNKVPGENKNKVLKPINKAKSIQDKQTEESRKPKAKSSQVDTTGENAHETLTEEELVKNAIRFEKNQPATTALPALNLKVPNIDQKPSQADQTKLEDDGTNINSTLVFAHLIFRHGDRYKGIDPEETYPNDPYAIEDPFWLPYGCDQLRNKGKMRSHWLGQYLRKRYAGFLPEQFYHFDVRMTSADLDRCIDSAHTMAAGLYPPKGINIWNDNVGKYYQPIPVRTLHSSDDIFLNEEVTCPPYEKELKKVLTKKMKNFNKKYQYMYEYLEMYAGMPVKNLEDVAQIYTTLRIENENGRKLPEWVNLVFPTNLKMLNSYYNQIRYSSHFFKRTQAGPLLTILMDELKQKSLNRLKPNYKMKFWSGFDTTILKLLYTMKETQPSLDKAEDLLETDYSGVLIIEMHLINKTHFVKVLYINMDPSFWKSHAPRAVQICDGLTLCPLDTFLERMTKYRITQKQWFHQCNVSYCPQENQPDNSIKLRSI